VASKQYQHYYSAHFKFSSLLQPNQAAARGQSLVLDNAIASSSWIIRLYCKPDMTSSWFLRQGTLHAIFLDRIWKSDYDFLIVIHSNFLSAMHGFEITSFYSKPDMTSSWFLRQGPLHAIFHDGFWKTDYDFLIVIHSNVSSAMHGFRDNEVLLPTGHDVIIYNKLWIWQRVEVQCFSTTTADAINMAKPCRAACLW